jgi:hypothetical protein
MTDIGFHLGDIEVSTDDILKEISSSYPDEDSDVLKARLSEDGYLCIRGLIPRDAIMGARKVLYDGMRELDDDSTFEYPKGKAGCYMGNKEFTHQPAFLEAVENPSCYDFFEKLFDEEAISFDYKWARSVPEKAAGTQAHMDVVYMGRGSQRLHTMWTPLGDIERENGPMVVLDKSHNHPAFEKIRQTYGKMDVDRDKVGGGWFSNDYKELADLCGEKWLIGDYQAGDVIIMGLHMFHGSLRNEMDKVRFTCDVRYQPASEPRDNRWIGDNPIAHRDWWKAGEDGETISIEEARAEWGV